MARIYANSCERMGKNFNEVPARIADKVKEIILADGYIIQKNGKVVKKSSE